MKKIRPPKGVKLPKEDRETTPEKGDKLFDCEAEELNMVEIDENMRI